MQFTEYILNANEMFFFYRNFMSLCDGTKHFDRDRDQCRDQKYDGTGTGTRNMTGPGPGLMMGTRFGPSRGPFIILSFWHFDRLSFSNFSISALSFAAIPFSDCVVCVLKRLANVITYLYTYLCCPCVKYCQGGLLSPGGSHQHSTVQFRLPT